ncbi:NCLDV major capsid protein [Indivirus ILV1]|uniref:NCLDV major capsid protein n=1 Tax=Indivirus ILV1 TaxID=1977633 RepID=A0A1V0SDV8_9VIRU|nr:NCLDV major capsid protein [Indivirus ILV1]
MAGGLLQLIAYGAEDMYLTNNPQITFFKVAYNRATNFSMQTFEKTFNDNPDFGGKGSVKLYRLGDLATKMYLRVRINKIQGKNGIKFAWIRRLGHAMLKSIEIKIGGVRIDKHYGTWLDIWYELSRTGKHDKGYKVMIGDVDVLTNLDDKEKPEYVMYIPLQFWFNRFYGLALPLIAIQYHDIYINIEFEEKEKLIIKSEELFDYTDVKILEVGLVTDYIFLDMEERERFAIVSHEYLIEQLQYYENEPLETNYKRLLLDFNNPSKELIWAARNGKYIKGDKFLCYSNKKNWRKAVLKCSKQVLYDSIQLLKINETPPNYGIWEEFEPGVIKYQSYNGNLTITNKSKLSLWINVGSLMIGEYSITDKIIANINVNDTNTIIIKVYEGMLSKDISIPLSQITDTRCNPGKGIYVYQFSNYGKYITGEKNPLKYAKLEYNDQDRVDKRNRRFFGDLQSYINHSNTPAEGINLYSFSFDPEKHQPMGESNFSNIENIFLSLWFDDEIVNPDSRLYIYTYSYNVFRIISGVSGLAY